MITYELLKKFCSQDKQDPRAYLNEPFAFNENVYATNGHIMVRVEQTAGLRYRPDGKDYAEPHSSTMKSEYGRQLNMAESCDKLIADSKPWNFAEMPEWDRSVLDFMDCDNCVDGYVFAEEYPERNEIKVFCSACDGDPKIRIRNEIGLGPTCADSFYLRLIESLPNPKISIPDKANVAIPFSFDGGVGLLMPMLK